MNAFPSNCLGIYDFWAIGKAFSSDSVCKLFFFIYIKKMQIAVKAPPTMVPHRPHPDGTAERLKQGRKSSKHGMGFRDGWFSLSPSSLPLSGFRKFCVSPQRTCHSWPLLDCFSLAGWASQSSALRSVELGCWAAREKLTTYSERLTLCWWAEVGERERAGGDPE